MLLQGDLQKVFDALYHMGVIDPVLEMDWGTEFEKLSSDSTHLERIVQAVNSSGGDYRELMDVLGKFEHHHLGHLAMVVAKELVGFHTNQVLH